MVRFSRPEMIKTLTKLEALSVDLRLILDGYEPSEHQLDDAPLLNNWRIVPAPFRVLVGEVTGHPKLADGEIATSQLFMVEDGKTWARTFSRYYRLGTMARRG